MIQMVTFQDLFGQKKIVGAIGFYNVENLFDTVDDPEKRDEEYTPGGRNEWDEERYADKRGKVATVLSQLANGADIVGLAEVENLFVVSDLVASPELSRLKYQIVHQESPDRRGIDCALIYRPDQFKLIEFETLTFPEEGYYTRDILHVTGLYSGDTLHVFVNHWPSRLGGGADKRNAAAGLLRGKVDELLAANPGSKIVVMGDFNDDPINKSIKKTLNASDNSKLKPGQLYNPSAGIFKQGLGTLFYRGTWNLFDQIIVSSGLLKDPSGVTYLDNSFSVFGPNWMRVSTGDYMGAPKRSFVGGVYQGGYSDHFPTYIILEK